MARHYYVAAMEDYLDPDMGPARRPALPVGVTRWAEVATPGRDCMVVVSPQVIPATPTLGANVQIADLTGLDDQTFRSRLPIRVAPGIPQVALDAMTDAVGFGRLDVDTLKRGWVRGL